VEATTQATDLQGDHGGQRGRRCGMLGIDVKRAAVARELRNGAAQVGKE